MDGPSLFGEGLQLPEKRSGDSMTVRPIKETLRYVQGPYQRRKVICGLCGWRGRRLLRNVDRHCRTCGRRRIYLV